MDEEGYETSYQDIIKTLLYQGCMLSYSYITYLDTRCDMTYCNKTLIRTRLVSSLCAIIHNERQLKTHIQQLVGHLTMHPYGQNRKKRGALKYSKHNQSPAMEKVTTAHYLTNNNHYKKMGVKPTKD